ncbi:hypothetical protein JYG35_18330 [Pseudomonas rhodesiae]|uniref:hypothetical protein n=1 Tax=Pseudomonas rhodesiae TaxID=76760 RepID=UPI001BCDEAF1|nr:hypothetical protein [Pseudomonas rhodesiae]QVN05590.1 hypothetical protein JYG35_18330 [Pseudomonas rhodesiae]
MIKPKSSLQAFVLLFVYCFIVFMLVSIVGVFLGAVINYVKIEIWILEWQEITGLVKGALIYTVFATIGIWALSRIKARKEGKAAEKKE